MQMFELMIGVGHTLGQAAPVFRFLLPVVFLVGIGLMAYFGYKGVTRGRTLMLLRGRGATGGYWVEGAWARILGGFYLAVMLPMFAAIGVPLSLGLTGIG